MDAENSKIPSYIELIKFSLRNFGIEHYKRNLYISVIVIFSILLSFFKLILNFSKKKFFEEDPNTFLLVLLNIKSLEIMFELTKSFFFEKCLVKMGPFISAKLMEIIIFTEQKKVFDMSPGQIEYNISEGLKAIGKISRVILHDLISSGLLLIFDLVFIFMTDKSETKNLSIFCLVSVILIMILKFYQVSSAMTFLYRLNAVSYGREKTYVELLDNIQIIKMSSEEKKSEIKYKGKVREWIEASYKYRYAMLYNTFVYDVLGYIFIAVTTILYVEKNNKQYISDAIQISSVANDMIKTCSVIVKIHNKILESITEAKNIIEYIELEKHEEDENNKIRIDTFNDKIEIKNLTYSVKGKKIFEKVDMVLNKGEKIALFGRNGSGKSSIFKVLLAYDNYEGDITIDGIDIKNILARDYRSLITHVPQDTRLFDETIYSNLMFGHNRPYGDVIIQCKRLGIHERIMELKDGYNTVVGETGKNINGGLRQKIFYARALLRDTPIYLFDEPTNNLDEKGSEFLLDHIQDDAFSNKTFFVIIHDVNILKKFSKRYIFDQNKFLLDKD